MSAKDHLGEVAIIEADLRRLMSRMKYEEDLSVDDAISEARSEGLITDLEES